jgi:tRNA nucleotidyltransferase (CCA-adding enzyme)
MTGRIPPALAAWPIPPEVLRVLARLDGAGHRSYLVGGAVRDVLLGRARETYDFDVATPAAPAEVTALFRKVIPTGIEHGTVTVVEGGEHVEVTTFRGEGAYRDGRRPEAVTFHRDVDRDLARRDFTINALAFDPLGPEFRDPFGGEADLAGRVVRAVGEPAARFGEDGLRAVRAVRFAAQLGFEVEPRTREAIPGALDVVRRVAVERIAEELSRLAVAPHARRGLELARATGVLEVCLPDLDGLDDPDLDHALDLLERAPAEPAVRWAALLHPLGAGAAERVIVELRLPRRLSEEAAAIVRAHACPREGRAGPARDPEALRRWLAAAGPERVPALRALALGEADAAPEAARAAARAEAEALFGEIEEVRSARPPLSARDLALDGRAVMGILGVAPGPHVGAALAHLLDRVLADPSRNARESLEAELRRWWASGRRL